MKGTKCCSKKGTTPVVQQVCRRDWETWLKPALEELKEEGLIEYYRLE